MDVRVTSGIDVRLLVDGRVERRPLEDLDMLIALQEGLVWVDIARADEEGTRVLTEVFGFHPMAVRDCVERNHLPKFHAYSDHVLVILHSVERGAAGRVHTIELDQFVGPGFLVTVHGPDEPGVAPEATFTHTDAILRRLESGRLSPASSFELSHALASAIALEAERFVGVLAMETGKLERTVMEEAVSANPEAFLEELFTARHELLTVRTSAALSREIYSRMATLARFIPGDSQDKVLDIVDQFERVGGVVDAQKEYLQGVIEFYRVRTETKMTIAAERLAVIAAVTLPVTALSSIYGMNVIVNNSTHFVQLAIVIAIMLVISLWLLRWAKRQGWW